MFLARLCCLDVLAISLLAPRMYRLTCSDRYLIGDTGLSVCVAVTHDNEIEVIKDYFLRFGSLLEITVVPTIPSGCTTAWTTCVM